MPVQADSYVRDETRPLLLNFTLDMDDGLLDLTFDDVFDRETLMPQHITLQSDSATEPASSYTLQKGSTTSPDGFSISINLAKVDLDEIKMRSLLATSKANTYISLSSQVGRDVATNPVTAIVIDEAQQVLNFTGDTTRPYLERFSLNLNVEVAGIDRGSITLVFSEAVNITSLDLTDLTLQNTPNISEASETYTLTGGDLNPTITGVTVNVTLTKFDTDNLKELTYLGTTINDTYISFPDTLVVDMNDNPIISINQFNATMATGLDADIIPPELIKFSLDMDGAPCLELIFSETVNVSSLDPARIILLSSADDPPVSAFTLNEGNVTSVNDTVVRVCFTHSDANAVKRLRQLATSPINTYLRFEEGMVYDNGGNAILAIPPSSAFQVRMDCYTEDTTRPSLTGFDLNLTDDILTLSFSETVSVLEFNFTGITIIGGIDLDSIQRQLIGGNLTSGDSDLVSFTLTTEDANFIKNNSDLATEVSNTFILVDNTTTFDMNLNPVEHTLIPIPVNNFTADMKSPALKSYEFDLNQGTIMLSFSETVDASSLDVTQIEIHDTVAPLFTLTNSSATNSSNGPDILVILSADDLNRIKQLVSLATSINNTYLTITQATINDTSMNMVEEIITPLKADRFIPDETPPQLLSFRLDMNNTVPPLLIVLTFSETVQSNSISPQQFTLRVSANSTSDNASFSLTGGLVSSINSTKVTITVNSSDLEDIRLRPPLGHYTNTTYISITDTAVVDMAGRPVVPILFPALPAAGNDADLVPPFLSKFSFDLNIGSLILTFSENVDVSTLVISQITLLNKPIDSEENFTLANSTSAELAGNEIQVNLTTDELNAVKQLTSLASSQATTFISLEANTINDIADNDALSTAALQVDEFTPDTTRPELLAFNFSLATREITLVFSETVNASSIDPTGIIFVSSRSALPEESHQLTGGMVRSDSGTEIVIEFTVPDKNAIKAFTMLAISNDTLYISVLPQLASDNAGNRVKQIPTSSAIAVSTFTPDLDRPSLLSFDLDMDRGVLTLHFNETVNRDTLTIGNFTLQDNATLVTTNHSLVNSTVQNTDAADIEITLSMFDLNEIKRKELCYADSVCYLILEEGAVLDMVDMPIVAIPDGFGQQVSNLTNDTTSPNLEEFTYINLDMRLVRLSFSETIDSSSLNFTTITLVDIFNPSIANVTLTGGFTDDDDMNIIEFTLEASDVEDIKANNFLCTHRGNCYITFSSGLLRDMVGNAITPVVVKFPGFPVMFYGKDGVLPQLSNFTLDLDLDRLVLTFDEPVSAASLEATGITIQSSSNTSNSSYYHMLTGGSTTSSDGPVITISLLTDDVNALKASVFAKNVNNTYIAITTSTITDTAFTPNHVMEISTDRALQAIDYVPDVTSPSLVAYTLNLNVDRLLLTFNEPVDPRSVDCSQITVQNSTTEPISMTQLTGCLIDISDIIAGVEVLTLNLVRPDITAIKANRQLATSSDSLFISFTNATVTDTAGQPVEAIPPTAGSFVSDITRPSLVSFSYSQLLGNISFTFSDVVDATTLDPTSLTLQHATSSAPGRTFSPSPNSTTNSDNGYIIVLELSHFDLLRLKSNTGLARDENDTYLTFRASLIDDTKGVDVVPITDGKAVKVAQFTPDLVPPTLVNYRLDLDNGEILISFSDTVDTATFNATKLTLLNSNNASTEHQLQLTGGNITRSVDGTQITLSLNTEDLNEIKQNIYLATEPETTYLSVDYAAVYDLAVNPFQAIAAVNAVQPQNFTEDSSAPILTAFSLDMNTGDIVLTFDETVHAASLDVTELTLQNRMTNSSQQHTLTMGNSTLSNSTVVSISLSQADIDSINKLRSLASEATDTYLSITPLAIQDMNGNAVEEITNMSALAVANYTSDTTSPQVVSIDLDLDSGVVTFMFSEVVAYSTFNDTQLTLQNVRNTSATNYTSYTLQNSTVRPVDSTLLYLDLSAEDLNEIKRLSDLATTVNNTYFVFTDSLVADTFGNAVVNSSQEEAVPVRNLTADHTPPELVGFTLNMNTGVLTLTFNETVNATSIDISAIAVQSSSMSAVESYSLQSSTSSLNDSTLIVVYLDQNDLDAIKLFTMLAINENKTYLNLSTDLISDMNNNRFSQDVVSADSVIPDTTAPELYDYIFDLNEGMIVVNFTEAVDVGTLNITRFVLHNSADVNSSVSYRLSIPSGSTDMNGKIFNITISKDDLDAIKASFELAISLNTTYLFMENGSIADMAGNMVLEFDDPLEAASFIPDTTRPQLLNATFNFNGGLLTLYFSETVDATTFDPTEIVLQNEMSLPTISMQLTGGNTSSENSTAVTITLLTSDLNKLKNHTLFFTSPTVAFVSVTNRTVLDMSNNSLVPAPPSMAVMVDSVTRDSVKPEVLEFDLDMDEGLLTVYFSETIDPSTLDVTQFSLQSEEMNSSVRFNFTGSVSVSWNLTYVVISITTPDINEIKILETLAVDDNSTYLLFTDSAAADYANNSLVPSNGSQGVAVSEFTPDTTPPELSQFNLDFSGKPQLLHLTFSEPVRSDSLLHDTITLQSVINISAVNVFQYYTLTGGNVTNTSSDMLSFTIQLPFIDVVNIQSRRMLAISMDSTHISLTNGTVLDMAYNPSASRSNETGLPASFYQPDAEAPSLETFTYDADQGVLVLTFSEAVDVSTFTVANQLTIQQAPGNPSSLPSKRLVGGNVSTSDWYIVNVTMTTIDFDTLRVQVPYNLCTNTSNCYISSTTSGFVQDTSGRPVSQVVDGTAIPASDFIPDETLPVLVDFSFDVQTLDAVLHLTFSEPVKLDFNFSQIEFHNSGSISSSTSSLALSGGMATPAASSFTHNLVVPPSTSVTVRNTVEVDLALTKPDLNLLLSDTTLGTDVNNTFLFLFSSALTDMYDNEVDEMGGQTVQAFSVLPDSTPPELSFFSFDLDNGLIVLTFSESVNASSLDPTAITLQSSSSSTVYSHTLTGGNATTENKPEVTLQLTVDDLNEVKRIAELATSRTNTYLSADADTVYDMAGFNLTIIPNNTAKQATGFIQDRTNPVLVSFTLNLTSEELVLTFDETVSYSSVIPRLLSLQSGPNGSAINITDSSTVSESNSTVITIFLSRQDLNRIKLDTGLAVSLNTTYLIIGNETLQDMANVPNLEQTLLADNFTADMKDPYLETFLFDLDEGLITLNFNEAVDASSVNVSQMTFLDNANGSVVFAPEDLIVNSTNGPRLKLYLTTDDLNSIKQNTSLYTAMANTFLNLGRGFVVDMNNNPLETATNIVAVNFTADIGDPVLTSFNFDLDKGLLQLIFSETVNASSFDPAGITIQSVHNATIIPTDQHTLTGGSLTMLVDSIVLTLNMTTTDLNIIKARGIALDNTTTWLTLTNSTVLDMSDNPVTPIVNNFDAEPVTLYDPDITEPVLVNFTLDLTQELLLLTFSETVDATSVNATQFTLLSSPTDPALHNYTLTSDSKVVSPHGPVINVSLSVYDLNEIKKLTGLATSPLDTFLALTDMAASDRSGNPVLSREGNTSLQAAAVIEDLQKPELDHFTFDLNEGLIIFTFSETVNASSLNVAHVTLLSSNTSNATMYTLTGGTVLSEDGPEVTLMLSFYDLNEIKHLLDLMTGADNYSTNSYLTINASAIRDNDGNAVTTIPVESALQAELFISDTTSPELVQFHLDLNMGVLTLNFTEAVNSSSLATTGLILLSNITDNDAAEVELVNVTVIAVNQSWIMVNITESDLNEIKAYLDLATDGNNTFLIIATATIFDTSGNPVLEINTTDAIPVSDLTSDKTSPVLESFDLDMDEGVLLLTFSETVLAQTLTPAALTLQAISSLSLVNPSLYYTLMSANVTITAVDHTVVSLLINNSDLNEIKKRPQLAIAENSTFLSFTENAINDTSSNKVIPILPSNGLPVTNYTRDTTPPKLASFDFDLNNGQLTLRFTETVDKSTIRLNFYELASDNTTNATTYAITGLNATISSP